MALFHFFRVLLVCANNICADSSATAWTPELEMKVKAVGSVRVSPNGKKVLALSARRL